MQGLAESKCISPKASRCLRCCHETWLHSSFYTNSLLALFQILPVCDGLKMQWLAQQRNLTLIIGRDNAAEFIAINVLHRQVSCLKYSEAELQISQSNATNSTRAEQAIKLVYETCIYSTAWLKMRLFSHHNFAACHNLQLFLSKTVLCFNQGYDVIRSLWIINLFFFFQSSFWRHSKSQYTLGCYRRS